MKFKSKLLQKFYTQWSLLKNNKQKHLLIQLAERLNDGTMTTKRLNKFMTYKPKENKHEPTKWQTCLKKAHEQELKCFEYNNKTYYRREQPQKEIDTITVNNKPKRRFGNRGVIYTSKPTEDEKTRCADAKEWQTRLKSAHKHEELRFTFKDVVYYRREILIKQKDDYNVSYTRKKNPRIDVLLATVEEGKELRFQFQNKLYYRHHKNKQIPAMYSTTVIRSIDKALDTTKTSFDYDDKTYHRHMDAERGVIFSCQR